MRRTILTTVVLLVAITGPPAEGQEPQPKAAQASSEANADKRGSDDAPIVVKLLPASDRALEAANEQEDREDEASHRRWTVTLTIALVVIGALQVYIYARQASLLNKTIESSDANAARQLRAYITHITGLSVKQDRNTGWKWEIRPVIRNCGQTPAYDVVSACRLALFPCPLPDDIDLTLPITNCGFRSNVNTSIARR